MTLLLASRSQTRRAMLEAAGVPFEAVSADLEEDEAKARLRGEGLSAEKLAMVLAVAKARSVAASPRALVLGCDQTLELEGGEALDKPGSREEAAEQLRLMSGKTHRLHSAAAILEDGHLAWQAVESVSLWVRPLSGKFIESYLEHEYDQIRWSVGGYRIEGPGAQLFERIEGSHFAVLGLPLLPLLAFLRVRGLVQS